MTGAVEDVESQLASDRRLYGASFHRVAGGQKVRLPPWEVIVTEGGVLLHNGSGGVVEQIGELLPSGPKHDDCDCIECRPWTT